MYAAVADPYCYPGTQVLKNIPDLREQAALAEFEAISFAQRAEEPLPDGRLSVTHFLAVHRHLFQDVYRWAGKPRTIRIAKGGNPFCYPENIRSELRNLFNWLRAQHYLRGRDADSFAVGLTHFLAELNAVHAFREGNGRTQLAFAALVAAHAEHPLHFDQLEPIAFLDAMIASFAGNEAPLAAELRSLI
jgi:cell filamentation protein